MTGDSVLKALFYQGIEKGIQFLNSLINLLFISKLFGNYGYGELNYFLFLSGLGIAVSNFGLEKVVPVVVNEDNQRVVLFNSVLIKLFVSFFYFLACSLVLFLNPAVTVKSEHGLLLIGFTILFSASNIFDAFFSWLNRISLISVVKSISILVFILIKFLLLSLNRDIVLFYYVFALEGISIFFFYVIYFFKEQPFLSFKYFDRTFLIEIASKGAKLFLYNLIIYFYSNILIIYLKNVSQNLILLSEFSVVQRISEFSMSICSVLSFVFLPKLTKATIDFRERFLSIFVIAGFLVLVLNFILSPLVLDYYRGFGSLNLMKLLIAFSATPFMFMSYFLTIKLIVEGNFKLMNIISLSTAAIGITCISILDHFNYGDQNNPYVVYFIIHFFSGFLAQFMSNYKFHLQLFDLLKNIKVYARETIRTR